MILALVYFTTTVFVAYPLSNLFINAQKARLLNVPLVYIPFDVNSVIWLLVQPLVWKLLDFLPVNWDSYPDFVRFSHRNWHFLEKSRPIERFGRVWALVSPGGVHLHVSDPDSIEEMFSRWKDFVRPLEKYNMLTIFGPSVFNVGLEDWPRHRKAISAPFNASTLGFAWAETLRQTEDMLCYWTSPSGRETYKMSEDLRSLSLNILAASAFGQSYDFRKFDDTEDPKSYRDTLFIVDRYIIPLMLIPYRFLKRGFVPEKLARIGKAASTLKSFMRKLVLEETEALSRGEPGSQGLISSLASSLIRKTARDSDAKLNTDGTKRKAGLSLDEIFGNIFIMNFAGHDTTANALAFAMMLLVANPQVQEWLREEIKEVTEGKPTSEWDYSLFSNLNRCQAVFLETLRLYAPITGIPKRTSDKMQTLKVGNQVLAISPGTEIFALLLGVQTDPMLWHDPYLWRPSRWIVSHQHRAGPHGERLVIPRKGIFFPWSSGPQDCVGQKFSQVEAVAMLACVFVGYEVRPKLEVNETKTQARNRVLACVDDTNYQMLLKMNRPDSVSFECVKA